jgi:hypothetical protein
LSGSAAMRMFLLFAVVNFALQDWHLIRLVLRWLWRIVRWLTVAAWEWGARTSWEILFSVGWLGMIQINEYAFGLVCLALFSFGIFSRLMHSVSVGLTWKIVGGCLIPVLSVAMLLTTVANKGDKPWSPTLDLIDSRWAARKPLPDPAFPLPRTWVLPPASLSETSQAAQDTLRRQLATLNKPPEPQRLDSAHLPPEATIAVWFAVGDDKAMAIMMRRSDTPVINCVGGPFTCYGENELKSVRVDVDFTGKKTRRLFFAVANTSETIISRETAYVALDIPNPSDLRGLSLTTPTPSQKLTEAGVEFFPAQNQDILPYSRTKTPLDFVADLTLDGNTISDVDVVFRIYAPNLSVVSITAHLHIVRN